MVRNMHIEQLYQHVISSIISIEGNVLDFSMKLARNTENSKRIEMVYQLLKDHNLFPEYTNVKKCQNVSEKYRSMGNDYFKKRDDSKALEMYNKAIVNAPINTPELALALGNRSAVLFSFKKFPECVNDINRAINIGYDESFKSKLLKRKVKCEHIMIDNKNYAEEQEIIAQCQRQFKLSKEQNPTIPCASKSVEISYSPEMGRSVIATDNIVPGEVLVVEHPYCSIVLEPFYLEYCYGCLKQSDCMIPCENCCFVMFCSEDCLNKSYNSFHKIDCPLMEMFSMMKFTKIELLAMRTVIQTKCNLLTWKAIRDSISESESIKDPHLIGFTRNSPEDPLTFNSNNYAAIHTLVSNVEKRSIADIFQKAITAAVCLNFLIEYTDFFSDCHENLSNEEDNSSSKVECILLTGGLLLHHNMTSPSNMHTISALTGTAESGYVDSSRFGGGAYAFLSLFNHSCAQNVVRYSIGSSIALVALRPVLKGQQLFDNYGFHHATDTIAERQKLLNFQYKFKCTCEACLNNWPLYFNLPPAIVTDKYKAEFLSHNLLDEKLIDDLKNGNRSVALYIVYQLYPYVSILEESAPSRELADYQETIKQCWALFGNIARLK